MANQVGFILFGKEKKSEIKVRIFTDSLPLLESIASIHRVDERLMQDFIDYLKEKLQTGEVESFSWLDSRDMLADVMTKDMRETQDMVEVLWRNKFRLFNHHNNLVIYSNNEFKIMNRKLKNINSQTS